MARVAEYLESKALRKALTTLSGGSLLQEKDDDRPRDTLLELLAGAVFVDAGFAVALTTNAEELRIEVPGIGSGIAECKRPRNAGSIFRKFQAAANQIGRRARADKSIKFGIPIIGFDLVIFANSRPHAANNETELDAHLEREKRRIINGITECSEDRLTRHLSTSIPFGAVTFSGSFFLKAEQTMAITTMFSHFSMGDQRWTKLPVPLENLFAARPSLYLSDLRTKVKGNLDG